MNARRIGWTLILVVVSVITVGAPAVRADTFTLDGTSPTLPLIPAGTADLLWDVPGVPGAGPPPPSIGYPFAGPGGMGLMPGDVVDAISDGMDPVDVPHTDYF